jgi:exodeoxyribonuclease VII large subunit
MREPVQPQPSQAAASVPIMSVGELTSLIKGTLRQAPRLREVWVEGEVGQVSISAAGHCYFTLKDDKAQLKCVIFRDDRLMMPFEARTGLRLVAQGGVDVFEPQGVYQLYVRAIQPSGFGDLALRFEALKAKLAAEGLFATERKRRLPPYPQTIGVVTSLSGAVLHDIRRVLARRWPQARVVVSACQVQGQGAERTIVAALRRVARWTDPQTGRATDVVILARGGGSLEDLWPFNDEAVVRAVAAHPCPIVVGVGHETDVTLAEFAADVRAATPSVAAELVAPSRLDEQGRLNTVAGRMRSATARALAERRQQLTAEARALDGRRPDAVLKAERERIGLLLDRAARVLQRRLETDRTVLARQSELLPGLMAGRIAIDRADLGRQSASLSALSPYATLERGYSIVRGPEGAVLRSAGDVRRGDPISVKLQHGELGARVEDVTR